MIKNIFLITLLILALVMIFIGVSKEMIPPTLTGIGFIIIAALFYERKK